MRSSPPACERTLAVHAFAFRHRRKANAWTASLLSHAGGLLLTLTLAFELEETTQLEFDPIDELLEGSLEAFRIDGPTFGAIDRIVGQHDAELAITLVDRSALVEYLLVDRPKKSRIVVVVHRLVGVLVRLL